MWTRRSLSTLIGHRECKLGPVDKDVAEVSEGQKLMWHHEDCPSFGRGSLSQQRWLRPKCSWCSPPPGRYFWYRLGLRGSPGSLLHGVPSGAWPSGRLHCRYAQNLRAFIALHKNSASFTQLASNEYALHSFCIHKVGEQNALRKCSKQNAAQTSWPIAIALLIYVCL